MDCQKIKPRYTTPPPTDTDMSTTTHTPGPWRVSKHASGLLKIETKDRVICDGFAREAANAALIAAAPELLEALKNILDTALVVDAGNKNQFGTNCHGFAREVFEQAHAAITKATTLPTV